jgi:hypothetical protein
MPGGRAACSVAFSQSITGAAVVKCVGEVLTWWAVCGLVGPRDSCCVARVVVEAVTRPLPRPHK